MKRILYFSIALLLTFCLSLTMGANSNNLFFAFPSLENLILFRLPRTLLGLIVGASLGISGASLQSILRNNLASPYTLGIASTASLGASVGIFLGFNTLGVATCSIVLSLLCLFFLLSLFSKLTHGAREYILLVGVAIGFLASAIILSLQFFGGESLSFSIQKWLLGSLNTVGFSGFFTILVPAILSFLILAFKHQTLDILQFGKDFSVSKGIDIKKECLILLATIACLIGVLVSVVGPISFIGLLVPNFVKIFLKGLHKRILTFSAIYGALFLCLIDSLSRALIAPSEIPVGILCSLIGAPIFIALLIYQKDS